MRKLLLILLLIPIVVKAEEYTEYRDYIMNTDEFIEESDLIKREEIKLFNTYREDKESLGFINDCPYDFKYDSFITKPIKVFMDYRYKTRQDINIYNHNATNIFFGYYKLDNRIYDIKVTQNGKDVKYDLTINDEPDVNNILGDNSRDTYIDVDKNSGVKLYFTNTSINDLLIEFDSDKEIYSRIVVNATEQAKLFEVNASSFKFVSNEEFLLDNVSKNYPFLSANYYPKTSRIYECIKSEKQLLNEYVSSGDNLIKDDFIIKYNYYIREKIKDEETIVEKIKNEESVVLSSSDNLIPIEDSIDAINKIENDSLILIENIINKNIPSKKSKSRGVTNKESVLVIDSKDIPKDSKSSNFNKLFIIIICIVLSILLYFLSKKVRKSRIYLNHFKNNI